MQRVQLRLKQWTQQFWFLPALMTLAALALAQAGLVAESRFGVPEELSFVYGGGETGARSVLSAIATSSIGVAGTVFAITIAALSYAAGNMGPRLLDNFTRDRGNQIVLGVFIATFAFTIYTLRSVTGGDETPFVPHYNVTLAMFLAFACVGALVYHLAHVPSIINMTTVVNLLRDDLRAVLEGATREQGAIQPSVGWPPEPFWAGGEALRSSTSGYLQLVDHDILVRAAERAQVALRLYVRPGDYVFPNSIIAIGVPTLPRDVQGALVIGPKRTLGQDLEYSVKQLAEVAARALSPGVNDPITAIDVIDRFGDALCSLHDRAWPEGLYYCGDTLRLAMPATDFGGLMDAMFHLIRQYSAGSPAVTVHLLDVFRIVAGCLDDPARHREIRRHADLVYEDALRATKNSGDRADLAGRYRELLATLRDTTALS